MNNRDRATHLSISLPEGERDFILKAAEEAGFASASAFLRQAALEKAETIWGAPYTPKPPKAPQQGSLSEQIIATIDTGDNKDTEGLTFPSIRRFATMFSDQNREVLHWIAHHDATSIHELAQLFAYPYANLSRNLRTLEAIGVIGYEERDGQTLRPFLKCRQVVLKLPLRAGTSESIFTMVLPTEATQTTDAIAVLASSGDITTLLPDRGYSLLRLIAEHAPQTIAALAKRTGKSDANAYSLLAKLGEAGLTRTVTSGATKKPELLYDAIEVRVDLA